jgi:hypothetical protein
MLFDLKTGKRRRVIQIVFGFLAFIFFISFVGFGIGSDVSGGIFDAIGVGGNSSGDDAESSFERQIDDAESDLAKDPKDEKALTDLARYHYLAGQEQLEFDDAGQPTMTEEARTEWNAALDAWEDLLKADPQKIEPLVAGQIVVAYLSLGDLGGAASAQEVVAKEDPRPENLAQLSYFLYAGGNIEAGKKAADQAIAEATGSQKKLFERELGKLDEEARKIAKAEKKAGDEPSATGGGGLSDPFGGLGTDTGTAPPIAP